MTFFFVGLAGLMLTHRGARDHLDRAREGASSRYVSGRGRTVDATNVKDLEVLAAKLLAGAPLNRKDRKRAAATVRLLERR
jgi:hypothetical protein